VKTSGARALWLNAVAGAIMDGGSPPPSIDRLMFLVPDKVGTSINDGHVTAAIVFGEDRRKDFKAGQRFIIEEMVQVLIEHSLIARTSEGAFRWVATLDGQWRLDIDGRTITVWGQRERRMSRDRSMLGERDEAGDIVGPVGLFASGSSVPFELDVLGPRGGHEKMKFQVHPFAAMIPPMTEAERETLRASIARDGVKIPLVIFQKKILDGRNRGYFASLLNKPVRIEEFTGTEEEAKRYVAILNLHRRHLDGAQQGLIAFKLLGEAGKNEAALARIATIGRPGKLTGKIQSISSDKNERTWQGITAKKAKEIGLNVSSDAIRMSETIAKAPLTAAAVERGEISRIGGRHGAYQKALEELKQPTSSKPETTDSYSVNKRLGRCITELQGIMQNVENEMLIGTAFEISGKLDQIEKLVPTVRYYLRSRNIIR
jgi:hypothetical protein